jgi:hypothetical protein
VFGDLLLVRNAARSSYSSVLRADGHDRPFRVRYRSSETSFAATRQGRGLLDASTAIDRGRHIRDFTDRMKDIVTKEHLQKVCETYQRENGYFAARAPVAAFKRPGAVAIVWKQRFTRGPGEFVAEMLIVEKDGKYLVDHAMVF